MIYSPSEGRSHPGNLFVGDPEDPGRFRSGRSLLRKVAELEEYMPLAAEIERFWPDDENRKAGTRTDHREINGVMPATSPAPDEFLPVWKGVAAHPFRNRAARHHPEGGGAYHPAVFLSSFLPTTCMMLWLPVALLGALSQAAYSLATKVLLRWIHPLFLAGYSFLVASLILSSLVLASGIPLLGPGLVPAVAATVAINIAATILLYRALSLTDLSLCVPLLAFTPVFLILTSFVILGEIPSLAGGIGILLVAAGAFLLTQTSGPDQAVSLTTPLGILRTDRGVQSMLVVAFLYSLSVNFDKEVVLNSSPIFAGALVLFLLAVIFLVIAVVTGTRYPVGSNPAGQPAPSPRSRALMVGATGAVLALEAVSINTAYTMAIVPYVITVKRLSIFFSVLFGALLLHEQDIRGRMSGALVMIAGAAVIALWG